MVTGVAAKETVLDGLVARGELDTGVPLPGGVMAAAEAGEFVLVAIGCVVVICVEGAGSGMALRACKLNWATHSSLSASLLAER